MTTLSRQLCVALIFISELAFPISFREVRDLPDGILAPQVRMNKVDFQGTLRFDSLTVKEQLTGKFHVGLVGAGRIYRANYPDLPMVQRRMTLPAGKTAVVSLRNVKLEESGEPVDLDSLQDYVWSPVQHDLTFAQSAQRTFFPGKLVDTQEVEGELVVSLFPAQYEMKTGKLLKVVSADLVVEYRPATLRVPSPLFRETDSVLITTEALVPAAKLIQAYHAREFYTSTEIITVEEIAKKFEAVKEDLLPEGYKSQDLAEFVVHKFDPETGKGYQYDLAKKIMGYLWPRLEAGKLRFVTLLGDSEMVPPSYYFSVQGSYGPQFGVTDTCYGALEKCMEPKASVGRLPLQNLDQVKNHLAKLTRWRKFSAEAESEVALYGGKAFRGRHYIGELGTLRLLDSEKANWRGVKKYQQTAGTYKKDGVLDLVAGKRKSSFVYYLDHGNGNQWFVNDEFVSSKEVSEAKLSQDGTTPVIAAISCTNGAFDKPLVRSRIFGGSQYGETSVGVSLLRSEAGAVAYLGNGRPALGQPMYEIDGSGNLKVTGTTYGLQLLDTFYETYHNQLGGKIGELILKTMQNYVHRKGNDMTDDRQIWTYFNFTYLGDPVVRLPVRRKIEETFVKTLSETQFPTNMGLPTFEMAANQVPEVLLNASVKTLATLLKIDRWMGTETEVSRQTVSGKSKVAVKTVEGDSLEGTYLLKLENQQGVPSEQRVWFNAVNAPEPEDEAPSDEGETPEVTDPDLGEEV